MHGWHPLAPLALFAALLVVDLRVAPSPRTTPAPESLAQGSTPPLSPSERWRSSSLDPAPAMTSKPG